MFTCHVHIPATDYYPHFKTFLYTRWQSFWSRLHNNKLHTVKPSISSWSAPFHKNRCWETALAWLRIGHTRLTHAYLMSRSDPPYVLFVTSLFQSHTFSCPVHALIQHVPLLFHTYPPFTDLPTYQTSLQNPTASALTTCSPSSDA